jgi:hypothetical protein
MTNKLKIAAVAALIVGGLASPAFAQSADHTGSQMPYYYGTDGKQTWGDWGPKAAASPSHSARARAATPRNGSSAFAFVPGTPSGSFSPQATGGGSVGYNQNLRTDQW